VTGFFKPAPSLKPRQKSEPDGPPKIPAAHRYIFSVNALNNKRDHLLPAFQTKNGAEGYTLKAA
jgi:phosphatidylethanolamine-binding protein (PEBP) family uncharacterized protein